MGARTGPAAASNAVVRPVVEYLPDPAGTALLHGALAAGNPPVLAGHIYAGPNDFHGYGPKLQRFFGLAALAGRIVAARSSTIDAEREASPLNATALTILAQRAQEGRV